jgi:hypothetical protein
MIDNKLYNELCKIINANTTVSMLDWMAAHGQSVLLNWGEDDEHWECSWITSGKRFTGIRKDIPNAIRDALGKARTYYLENWATEAQ